jgi:ubiquitin-protein ligase E3 A
VDHYINISVKRQFDAFYKGFHRVCGGQALKMCRADELELLICGTTELNFKDLEAGAEYDDGYSSDHEVIK